MSMSRSPELRTLKSPGETVGSAGDWGVGERINEIGDAPDTEDAIARSSESSRSRRSFIRVNLGQLMRAGQKTEGVSSPDTFMLNTEDVLEVRLGLVG